MRKRRPRVRTQQEAKPVDGNELRPEAWESQVTEDGTGSPETRPVTPLLWPTNHSGFGGGDDVFGPGCME